MKITIVAALVLSVIGVAPTAADSTYDACVKLAGEAACVKPTPNIVHEPAEDPYREMMERERDRQLWRQHIYEQSDRRAAELHHGNFLRYCRPSSPACHQGLLD